MPAFREMGVDPEATSTATPFAFDDAFSTPRPPLALVTPVSRSKPPPPAEGTSFGGIVAFVALGVAVVAAGLGVIELAVRLL